MEKPGFTQEFFYIPEEYGNLVPKTRSFEKDCHESCDSLAKANSSLEIITNRNKNCDFVTELQQTETENVILLPTQWEG